VRRIAIKECSLAELLDDPMVGLVMKSDGVDRETLERSWWSRAVPAIGPVDDAAGKRAGDPPRPPDKDPEYGPGEDVGGDRRRDQI